MKKLLLLFLLTSAIVVCNAQRTVFLRSVFSNNNVYKTKDTLILKRVYDCRNNVVIKDDRTFRLIVRPSTSIKYQIVEDGDNPYIYVLPKYCFKYYDGEQDSIVDVKFECEEKRHDSTYNYYFKIESDIMPHHKYIFAQSIVGMPLTLPLKIRKLNSEYQFEANISLSYAFGYRVKVGDDPYKKRFLNVIPFAAGINSDKYFSNKEDAQVDALSFTYYSFGMTYEFRGLNVGLFGGWDKMFGERKNWAYQDKFWLSLGLGYKFGG